MPAIAPATTASAGLMNRQPALLATKPPIHPLQVREASGLPNRRPVTINADKPAAAAAKVVLTITSKVCPGVAPPNRIAPAEFSPSHPTQQRMPPNTTKTALCAGIALGILVDEYLPRRGPRIQTILNAVKPPTA